MPQCWQSLLSRPGHLFSNWVLNTKTSSDLVTEQEIIITLGANALSLLLLRSYLFLVVDVQHQPCCRIIVPLGTPDSLKHLQNSLKCAFLWRIALLHFRMMLDGRLIRRPWTFDKRNAMWPKLGHPEFLSQEEWPKNTRTEKDQKWLELSHVRNSWVNVPLTLMLHWYSILPLTLPLNSWSYSISFQEIPLHTHMLRLKNSSFYCLQSKNIKWCRNEHKSIGAAVRYGIGHRLPQMTGVCRINYQAKMS